MHLDQFTNPVFTEQDLFEALYKGQSLTSEMIVETNSNIKNLEEASGIKFAEPYPSDLNVSLNDYDSVCQQHWFMPEEYKTLDIEAWIWQQTPPWDPQHTRVTEELTAFKERNMLDLLRWLKYFVDNCSKQNVLWGIGRGSSVASYILFLLGVHSVDSIKYNLDWREFLR